MKKLTYKLGIVLFIFTCHQQSILAQGKKRPQKVTPKPTIPKSIAIVPLFINVPLDENPGGGEPTPECLVASAGSNHSICRGNSVQIGSGASQNYNYTYSWSPTAGLSAAYVANPIASPATTTTYTLTVTPKINLLVNGSFEYGNTGFNSDFNYLLYNATPNYGIEASPQNGHGGWCSGSPSEGNYMFLGDGDRTGTVRAWYQTVNVVPGHVYQFSGQFMNVTNSPVNDPNITIKINGTTISAFSLSYANCQWTNIAASWNSGSSSTATVEIYNNPTEPEPNSGHGNDFAMDNLSLVDPSYQPPSCPTTTSTTTVTVVSNPTINEAGPIDVCYYWESPGNASTTISTNLSSNIKWSIHGIEIPNETNSSININLYTYGLDQSSYSTLYASRPFTVTDVSTGCTSDPVTINFLVTPEIDWSYTGNASLYGSGVSVSGNLRTNWVGQALGYGSNSTISWQITTPYSAVPLSSTSQMPLSVYIPNVSNLSQLPSYNMAFTLTIVGSDHACLNTTHITQALDLHNFVNSYNLFSINQRPVSATPDISINESDILIYPNPVKNKFTISAIDEFKQVQIFSSKGELIKTINTKSKTATIIVSGFQPGTYFVNILSAKGIKVKKLLVIK